MSEDNDYTASGNKEGKNAVVVKIGMIGKLLFFVEKLW